MEKFIIVYTTTKNKKEAQKIAKLLIKEKLAACCNIFKIESYFVWEKKLEKTKEWAIFIKTKNSLFEKVKNKIKEIHSYSLPCIISFLIEKGEKSFLQWIKESTKT